MANKQEALKSILKRNSYDCTFIYIYDDYEEKNYDHILDTPDINDIPSEIYKFFVRYKEELTKELGGACFYLNFTNSSQDRREYHDLGLSIGFKAVRIINIYELMFYKAITSQAVTYNYGDIILISPMTTQEPFIDLKECYVYKKGYVKFKFVNCYPTALQAPEPKYIFQQIFEKLTSKEVLYFHKSMQIFYPNSEIFFYQSLSNGRAALLKARIITNDIELIQFDCVSAIVNNINFKIPYRFNQDEFFTVNSNISLPVEMEKSIEVERLIGPIMATQQRLITLFEITESTLLKINIDVNEIITVTCLSHENKSIKETKYWLPKKIVNYNGQINAIGIDLGTTRCCIALNRASGIEAVAIENRGERVMPSYVALDSAKPKCGKIVISRMREKAKNSIFDIKRIIGKKFAEIEIDTTWPFEVIESPEDGTALIQTNNHLGPVTMKPEEISAILLELLKDKAEEFQGRPLTDVTITVPAAFTEAQKIATLEAAKLAGWQKAQILPESIAAAFAYFVKNPSIGNSKVLLFDLGGGTLDVCVFKINDGQIEIVSEAGDTHLGGRDFDNVIMDHLWFLIQQDYGMLKLGPKKYKFMYACQEIKHTLSSCNFAHLDLADVNPQLESTLTITREEFETLSTHLLERIETIVIQALHKAYYPSHYIDKILMVGGGSRIPKIKDLLQLMFPNSEICFQDHPDEVVALGAAHYAYGMSGSVQDDFAITPVTKYDDNLVQIFPKHLEEIKKQKSFVAFFKRMWSFKT